MLRSVMIMLRTKKAAQTVTEVSILKIYLTRTLANFEDLTFKTGKITSNNANSSMWAGDYGNCIFTLIL